MIVLEDRTDTWSHGTARFSGPQCGKFTLDRTVIEETGPLRATIRIEASYRASNLCLWVRLSNGSPVIALDLRLDWHQKLKLVKIVFPLSFSFESRQDGVPGGCVSRAQNGNEYPFLDWVLARADTAAGSGTSVGFVCPDCTSLDGFENSLRFTLLRSPVFAWHDPAQLESDAFYRWTDQGQHTFRFRVLEHSDPSALKSAALCLHRAPICLDWTEGMQRGQAEAASPGQPS